MSLNWYAVIAKQGQDHMAAKGLREQGFSDVYIPKTFEKSRFSKPVGALLMSPYFFVLCDAERGEHAPIKHTRGVDRMLADNPEEPSPLRKGGFDFIKALRQTEEEEFCAGLVIPKIGRTDLCRGQRVRIDKPGVLTSSLPIEGIITQWKRRKVEVFFAGKTIVVDEVDVAVIE